MKPLLAALFCALAHASAISRYDGSCADCVSSPVLSPSFFASATSPASPGQSSQAPDTLHLRSTTSTSSKAVTVGGGSQWAMVYSPYTDAGGCRSTASIQSDIQDISRRGFKAVRLYSTDCNGLQAVGDAVRKYGLKLIPGIYVDQAGVGKALAQVVALCFWGQWDIVELIVIGNEAIFNQWVGGEAMASFIRSTKAHFKYFGYTGPCTTAEPLGTVQQYKSALCPVMDVAAANMHPFFNTQTTAQQAGSMVALQMQALKKACPGKGAYNLETGWPTKGQANGAAIPGVNQQKTAIGGIMKAAGGQSVLLSYRNDLWKQPGPLGVEQYWGCKDLFQPK